MYDILIRGGDLVDGTGSARRRADVGIQGDRVVAIGDLEEAAAETIDATGKVVTPGFVDVHTHYDAQVFWDGALTPSPLHGVTTALAGNCGFTIAPLSDDAADGDYLMRMLARVEGMPLESLREGVPWNWKSTAEYFDEIEGRLGINAGFMVGHSAIRRVVMGEESTVARSQAGGVRRDAGAAARRARRRRARLLVVVGAHAQRRRRTHGAVALRVARRARRSLRDAVAEYEGTSLEFIPMVGPFEPWAVELMAVDVGGRATAAQLERARRERQEPRRGRAEARGRHLRARARRPGGGAHRADELPGVPVVPVRLRPRRHAGLGRRDGAAARREAEVLRRRRGAGPARRAAPRATRTRCACWPTGATTGSTTSSPPRTSSTGAA